MFRDLWFPVDTASPSGTQSRSGESLTKPTAILEALPPTKATPEPVAVSDTPETFPLTLYEPFNFFSQALS